MAESAKLDRITTFGALLEYLETELDWPITAGSFEELTYDYTPAELGLQDEAVGGPVEIKQMRPLTANQPWGIFFLGLPQKSLPVTVLRRILGKLAVKKRASANAADRAAFQKSDLLFIAATGAGSDRRLAFAHFHESQSSGQTPVLRVLGWNADDTVRRLSLTDATLRTHLGWPASGTSDSDWRNSWAAAFTERKAEAVRTSKELATALADLAQSMRSRANTLLSQETDAGPLRTLHKAFRDTLIHDLKPDDFADMYAQTIAYGLLSARISRASGALTPDDARLMAPPTSPFLEEMLGTFLEAGGRQTGARPASALDFDELGVGAVVELLRSANMEAVLADFDKNNPDEDPVIHFYELFLKEYDPRKRMQRGVFYTPRPVVNFIVRSVDEILRTEFGLGDGLASTATWGEVIAAKPDIKLPKGVKATDAFVRILDPATGTGTFLVECVDLIHKTMVANWTKENKSKAEIAELWNDYVPNHLLPRLTGFELMMAPYAIAHVKLGLKLSDTGYKFRSPAHAQIYLTNALEPAQDLDLQLSFMSEALAHEARAANKAKEARFTVAVGNPPYAKLSSNRSAHITAIMEKFKTTVRSEEIQIQALSNDYVKFYAQVLELLERSPVWVSALITDNSFLDGPLFRDMRRYFLVNTSNVDILDLGGNSRRADRTDSDENVFDIQQGVAIAFLRNFGPSTQTKYGRIFGSRDEKLAKLRISKLGNCEIYPVEPSYILTPRSSDVSDDYVGWISLTEAFAGGRRKGRSLPFNGSALATRHDRLAVDFTTGELTSKLEEFFNHERNEANLRERFGLCETAHFDFSLARKVGIEAALKEIRPILYRPFDVRCVVYNTRLLGEARPEVMRQLLMPNVALLSTRRVTGKPYDNVFVTDKLVEYKAATHDRNTQVFPLWLYRSDDVLDDQSSVAQVHTFPNIAPAFAARVAALTGLAYDDGIESPKQGTLGGAVLPRKAEQVPMFDAPRRERGDLGKTFGPRDLFDYMYAVLHSPAYRSRYADYLRSDFARIPLPSSGGIFEALVLLGSELVALHLLDASGNPDLANPKAPRFVGTADPRVEKGMPSFRAGRVYINSSCWFQDVPERVWSFHLGGYQPAQKWLKDRAAKGGNKQSSGRVLSPSDILHYSRVIAAIDRTIDVMAEIDTVIDTYGGWPAAFRGINDDTVS